MDLRVFVGFKSINYQNDSFYYCIAVILHCNLKYDCFVYYDRSNNLHKHKKIFWNRILSGNTCARQEMYREKKIHCVYKSLHKKFKQYQTWIHLSTCIHWCSFSSSLNLLLIVTLTFESCWTITVRNSMNPCGALLHNLITSGNWNKP